MADAPTNLAPAEPVKRPKTRGDKLFDRLVYGVMNGIGTFVLTVPLAYWAEHGKGPIGGKQYFDQAKTWLEAKKLSPKSSRDILMTSSLFLGGTLMVLPVRLAEAFRPQIVKRLNGGETAEAEAAAVALPPQTWGSLIKARLVAWGVVFSSFKLVQYGTKAIGKPEALGTFEDWFANKACGLLKLEKGTAEAPSRAFRYGRIAALDLFATAASATLLYVGSRFFARHRSEKQQEKLATHTPTIFTDQAEASPAELPDDSTPEKTVNGQKLASGRVEIDAVKALSV